LGNKKRLLALAIGKRAKERKAESKKPPVSTFGKTFVSKEKTQKKYANQFSNHSLLPCHLNGV